MINAKKLEEIAKHIVKHFPNRLDVVDEDDRRRPMKAMVISIDKFTAVKMYDKVQYHLKEEIKELRKKIRIYLAHMMNLNFNKNGNYWNRSLKGKKSS